MAIKDTSNRPAIFVSYRRDDTLHMAHLLKYALEEAGYAVFVDTGGIDTGDIFRARIRQQFSETALILLLVGSAFDTERLRDAGDPVAFELAVARFLRIPVLPVLLNGADVPSAEALSAELRWVFQTNAKRLRDQTLVADVDQLISEVPPMLSQALRPFRALWVDDKPANNERERRALRKGLPVTFEIAVSTAEAREAIQHQVVTDLIVTDRGRKYSSDKSHTAGETLIEQLSGLGPPIIVYTSPLGAERHRESLLEKGAYGVTADPRKLFMLVLRALGQASADDSEIGQQTWRYYLEG